MAVIEDISVEDFSQKLNEKEIILFQLVEKGTSEDVNEFIKNNQNVIILDKKDEEFRTVLQIAVLRRNQEMVKVLVDAGSIDPHAMDLSAALCLTDITNLLSNKSGNKHNKHQNETDEEEEEIRRMLKSAIENEDYKMTKQLLSEYNTVKALSLHCLCFKCRRNAKDDGKDILREAEIRLDVCHILSSPDYILANATNPILEALKWAKHLKKTASYHPENRIELLHLVERSGQLAVDLLETCNDYDDLVVIFKESQGEDEIHPPAMSATLKYKCLHGAIGVSQKQFIAHPKCQHVISKLWLGTYYTYWRKWSISRKMWHVLWQMLMTPVIFTLFLFQVKFAKNCLKAPINRFIYAVTSYIIFLAMVLFSMYGERTDEWISFNMDGYRLLLGAWVLGHILKIVLDCITLKYISYLRQWWTIYDTTMMATFIASAATFIMGRILKNRQTTYWFWMLLSQGLYAIAITLACLRTLQWLYLSRTLGPLVISFTKMRKVLQRFLIIFCIIMFSFSTGIYAVYKNVNYADHTPVNPFFSSYVNSLEILYWALFGKGESNYAAIPAESQSFLNNMNDTTELQESSIVGYTLWAFFHVVVVTVLLNMLIAIMTYYYQLIQNNSDTEWKFVYAALRVYYIEKNGMFPPPVNIIAVIFRLIIYFCKSVKDNKSTKEEGSSTTKLEKKKRYEIAVKKMIERYLQKRELEKIRKKRQADIKTSWFTSFDSN